jgi:hypothetical protein
MRGGTLEILFMLFEKNFVKVLIPRRGVSIPWDRIQFCPRLTVKPNTKEER